MAKQLDPVKKMVAQAVQHHLVTGPGKPELLPLPDEAENVEGEAISPLVTMVRVKINGRPARYFQVQVSEML